METSLIGKALNFGFSEYRFESYVSNFITSYTPYIYLLNHLKLAFANKNFFFIIDFKVKLLPLLKLFYKLNIIRRFTIEKTLTCRIFPNYTKFSKPITSIKNYYRLKNPIIIKKNSLNLLSKSLGNSVLVLETSKGLLTHKEALLNGLGGVLLFIIY
jgi:ribosomal protein S8